MRFDAEEKFAMFECGPPGAGRNCNGDLPCWLVASFCDCICVMYVYLELIFTAGTFLTRTFITAGRLE